MQVVASSVPSSIGGGVADQHRRTPSIVSPPPPPASTISNSSPAVRLPPVSIPREGFLPVSFNPERRQSINSDPFLHAFSATSDPSYLRRPSIDEASSLFGGPLGVQGANVAGSAATGLGGATEVSRAGGVMPNIRPHSSTAGEMLPPQQPFDPHANYQFGTSFQPAPGAPHSHPHPPPPFPGPATAYRFGGPSVAVVAPHETPSYFDYSMRRHSLTNNQQNGNSPTRYPGPSNAAAGGGPLSPVSSTKRKTSGENDAPSFNDGSYYPSQNAAPFPPSSSTNGNPPPNSKRRTSSMATDKMNNLALEGQRRESFSPTWEEEERRDSNDSHRSSGSHHSFNMYQYPQQQPHPPPPPPGSAPFDQRNPAPHPNPHQHPPHPPFMRLSNVPNFYEDSIGPRGSIARGMYEPLSQDFGRRPSIPGVSQMMQGQAPFYPGAPPSHSAPPTAQHPPSSPSFPPPPQPRSSASHQPAVMVSSSQTPTDQQTQSRSGSTGVPIGPPPQWPQSQSDVPPPPPHQDRQDSTGSLDPSAAGVLKDSPYSRSPQLRISHKLAERKRRKEMAQLFDDLRESLPVDRGLKSSKWEILTKAVEFIGQLKTFNRDLQNDNQNLRQHLNLPQSQPAPHDFVPQRSNSTPHPLQPAPISHPSHSQQPPNSFPPHPQHPVHNAAHIYDHSRPNPSPPISNHPDPNSHNASPRPHNSRTGSHASSHASSFSAENGMPPP